jgi:hypothetical protein
MSRIAGGPVARPYTVTKSYHFLEGRCKFPALRKQKFLFDTGKCFQLPKSYFSCHQNGKLLHSGERAVFHAWKCKSPALVLNSKMNGKTQATEWEESPPPLPQEIGSRHIESTVVSTYTVLYTVYRSINYPFSYLLIYLFIYLFIYFILYTNTLVIYTSLCV